MSTCTPDLQAPSLRFQIHGKEHTDAEFGLISAYLISTYHVVSLGNYQCGVNAHWSIAGL